MDLLSNITDHGFNKVSGKEILEFMKEAGFSKTSIKIFEDSEKEFPTGEKVKLHTEFVLAEG